MSLLAITYHRGSLEILDQLKLPFHHDYVEISCVEDGWEAIKSMKVRGAPAIAIVGCLSIAVELHNGIIAEGTVVELLEAVQTKLNHLVTARPTAINMAKCRDEFIDSMKEFSSLTDINIVRNRLIERFEGMLEKDVSDNRAVGDFGAEAILQYHGGRDVSVLTHCNTGSLATAGYGTALGVIRSLWGKKKLRHAYCTETRPYNQGARLTAYELVYEGIPGTLVCDSAAAALMQQGKVDAVVIGADQVALNGDTANKIGSYSLAVNCAFHKVPFYVAVPTTSINPKRPSGQDITIEMRPSVEMTSVNGVAVAAPGISCWNPGFDVTPASLITGGIITEKGVFRPDKLFELFQ